MAKTPKPKTLDHTKKQEVSYCIPLWLRDKQILSNVARLKARVEPGSAKDDPIAIVCYGPSLNDTWEKIRDFKYIMTCSGAHKFLIERGIIPTYHTDVDPREHKILLIGTPHKSVEYLICSTCHPKMLDLLEGYNVRLWHSFDASEEASRILPRGEWALTGGCSVGLRCMALSRILGFREQHVFGMDGSEGKTGKHAAAHPNQPKENMECVYDGVTYITTPGLLEAARTTAHELDQLRDVTAKFYGEGLTQHMMRDYRQDPTRKPINYIAFSRSELISQEVLELNAKLHQDNLLYGVGGGRHAAMVIKLMESIKSNGRVSVLDYGCGKGLLADNLPFPIWEYDPAIPGKSMLPRPADLVVCTDVLEHIEPDKLLAVLDDLRRCVKSVGYFVIHTGPAGKLYADGRNTHLIQEGKEWWEERLSAFFEIGHIFKVGVELHVVLGVNKAVKAEKWKAVG